MMMRSTIYWFLLGFLAVFLFAGWPQKARAQKAKTIGFEAQGYPAGVISTLHGGIEISRQQELSIRFGYNLTRRGDFGKHDNEEGGGPGFSLGYRYYTGEEFDGFFVAARADLWFMGIDWRDKRTVCGTAPPCFEQDVEGTSDITILQPTVEIGYNLLGGRSSWMLAPVAAFGWEFNIRTKGEDVGEGAILLGGLNISYLF